MIQFLILFHQAILENDLPTITNMYEQGWNKLTNVNIDLCLWKHPLILGSLLAKRMARSRSDQSACQERQVKC